MTTKRTIMSILKMSPIIRMTNGPLGSSKIFENKEEVERESC